MQMNTVPAQENPHAEVIGWHITAALNTLFMFYAPGVRWIPGYDGHALRARLSHALGEIAMATGETAPTWEHDGRSWCLQGGLSVYLGDTSITVDGTEVLAATDAGALVWLQLPSAAVVMDEIRHGGPLRDPYEIVHTLAERLEAPSTVETRDELVALLTAALPRPDLAEVSGADGSTVMTVGLPFQARERCLDIRVLLATDEILTIEALRTLADRGTERLASRCVRPSPALLADLRRLEAGQCL